MPLQPVEDRSWVDSPNLNENSSQNCATCNQTFDRIVKCHTCQACQQSFCNSCSVFENSRRLCKICYDNLPESEKLTRVAQSLSSGKQMSKPKPKSNAFLDKENKEENFNLIGKESMSRKSRQPLSSISNAEMNAMMSTPTGKSEILKNSTNLIQNNSAVDSVSLSVTEEKQSTLPDTETITSLATREAEALLTTIDIDVDQHPPMLNSFTKTILWRIAIVMIVALLYPLSRANWQRQPLPHQDISKNPIISEMPVQFPEPIYQQPTTLDSISDNHSSTITQFYSQLSKGEFRLSREKVFSSLSGKLIKYRTISWQSFERSQLQEFLKESDKIRKSVTSLMIKYSDKIMSRIDQARDVTREEFYEAIKVGSISYLKWMDTAMEYETEVDAE